MPGRDGLDRCYRFGFALWRIELAMIVLENGRSWGYHGRPRFLDIGRWRICAAAAVGPRMIAPYINLGRWGRQRIPANMTEV